MKIILYSSVIGNTALTSGRKIRIFWHGICYNIRRVKIQLTKTKTIDLNFGGAGGAGKRKSKVDLTGVELFSGNAQGCPAVRISRKKNQWILNAIGYLNAPEGELPECWEDTPRQPVWELPREFQSPSAALAVHSTMGSFGQASTDAIIQEMMHGVGAVPQVTAAPEPGKRRLGLKRLGASAAPQPVQQPDATPARVPDFPAAGVPVSENGRRFSTRPLAEEGFHLVSSIPEFQALWLGRLLPEGRRPTASSIQLADSALMASVLAQPVFHETKGNLLAVFVRDNDIYFAGYRDGTPILWRKCPTRGGYRAMCAAVKKTLGVDEELIDSVLEDSLIDPRPALEPFLHPVLEQLELARAYLAGNQGVNVEQVLLSGVPCGAQHWRHSVEELLKLNLVAPDPFEGFQLAKGVEIKDPEAHLVALGAALAAAEVES